MPRDADSAGTVHSALHHRAIWLIISILIAPSVVWILRDRSVWQGDTANYGQVATDLWLNLGHSLKTWARLMDFGLYFKAPGLVWPAQFFVPLRHVFPTVESALLLCILGIQCATLAIVYRIGTRVCPNSRLAPAIGTVLVGGCQLFVGLSHVMFVEPLQTLAVSWCYYAAACAPKWPKARIVIHVMGAVILGALAKATTPIYLFLPCLYCGYFLIRGVGAWDFASEWKTTSSRIIALAFGALSMPCALWYFRHFGIAWAHVRDSSSGASAIYYGYRDTVPHKLTAWWHLLVQSFFGPYLSWGSMAALAVGCLWWWRSRHRFRLEPLALVCALQIGIVLFAASLSIAVDSRYILPLAPAAGIVLLQLCELLPARVATALGVLAVLQWAHVSAASLNLVPPLADQSEWLRPVQTDALRYEEITRAVQVAGTGSESGRTTNIAAITTWFNFNTLDFFDAKRVLSGGSRRHYTDLGYIQSDVQAAWQRIEGFQPPYVITVAEPFQPPYHVFNGAALPALQRMRSDPRFNLIPFASRNGLLIFRFDPGTGAGSQPH